LKPAGNAGFSAFRRVCKLACFSLFDGQIVFFSHFFPTRLVLKEMHLQAFSTG
jgi:hypothetical protein